MQGNIGHTHHLPSSSQVYNPALGICLGTTTLVVTVRSSGPGTREEVTPTGEVGPIGALVCRPRTVEPPVVDDPVLDCQ